MRPQGGAVNQMGVGMTERWRRLAGLFALIAALTFAVAACGGGDDEEGAGETTEATGGAAERTFPELKVAYDGITVMAHPDTPVDCVTTADLYALFGPESDNISTWQDAGAPVEGE